MKQQIIPRGGGREFDWSSDRILVKATVDLTAGRLTMVEDTLKPGFRLARHYHKSMTEIFLILEGEVTFIFDDERVDGVPGMTINVPPNVMHEVASEKGSKLITVFSPGGFERYLEEMAALTQDQFSNQAFMAALSEKYDIWTP